jgi:hypothetical protein
MRLSSVVEGLFLLIILIVCLETSARDRHHGVHRGVGGGHGNQRSERPGRVGLGREFYAGNGCPEGSMRVVFAPDLLAFTIIFDQFVAQIDDGRIRRDAMTCNAVIPVTLPDGMQMEITRVDFRGFVALPDRAQAALSSTFNFRGRGGDRDRIVMHYDFQGPLMEDYEISSDTVESDGRAADSEVSPCGGSVDLKVNTRLQLKSSTRGEQASITVDSIDGSSHAVYYVNWRRCNRR